MRHTAPPGSWQSRTLYTSRLLTLTHRLPLVAVSYPLLPAEAEKTRGNDGEEPEEAGSRGGPDDPVRWRLGLTQISIFICLIIRCQQQPAAAI